MAPIVIPSSPVVAIAVAVGGVIPKTLPFNKTGIAVPSTTRSNPSSSTAAQHSGRTPRRFPSLVVSVAIVVPSSRGVVSDGICALGEPVRVQVVAASVGRRNRIAASIGHALWEAMATATSADARRCLDHRDDGRRDSPSLPGRSHGLKVVAPRPRDHRQRSEALDGTGTPVPYCLVHLYQLLRP